jgi:hypothetical protein
MWYVDIATNLILGLSFLVFGDYLTAFLYLICFLAAEIIGLIK